MAYLQERMTHYLTADPHLFVSEERRIQYGPNPDKDVWWIDALTTDPWKQTFYLGESTYNPSPTPLVRKIVRFYEIKSDVLANLSPNGTPQGWDVRPWLFVRREVVPFVLKRIPSGCYPKITHIEETAFPWVYEPIRRLGKEPNKFYADLDERYQV